MHGQLSGKIHHGNHRTIANAEGTYSARISWVKVPFWPILSFEDISDQNIFSEKNSEVQRSTRSISSWATELAKVSRAVHAQHAEMLQQDPESPGTQSSPGTPSRRSRRGS